MVYWFEIEVIYPVITQLDEADEMDDKLREIQLKNTGESKYKKSIAYFNLGVDPIMHLVPMFLTDEDYRGFYTEVVFESGNSITAVGKPSVIYQKFKDFVASLPEEPKENQSSKDTQ